MAYFPTLGEYTVYGLGDTVSEAIQGAFEALEGMMDFWANKGLPVPPPEDNPMVDRIEFRNASILEDMSENQ